jgi:hypothetical protein
MAGEGWEIVHKCHGIYRFGLCQLGLRRRSSFAVFWTAPVICLLLWPSQIYYRTQIWPKQHPSAFLERPTWTPKRRRFLVGCRLQRPIDYLGGIATVGFWSAAHCSNHLQPARRPSHLASPQSGAPRPSAQSSGLKPSARCERYTAERFGAPRTSGNIDGAMTGHHAAARRHRRCAAAAPAGPSPRVPPSLQVTGQSLEP